MSTMETSLKTNSALSDLVKNFLQSFKDKENSFKYVEQIDLMRPKNSKYIVVDFNDLVLERSIVLGITENPDVILDAFSRAIKEILQQRFPKYAEKIKDEVRARIINYPSERSLRQINSEIINKMTRLRWMTRNRSDGRGCQSKYIKPRKKALTATMSVCETYFIPRPVKPMAINSANIK